MIEMRWISVAGGSGRGLFYGRDGQSGELVLQYRNGDYFYADDFRQKGAKPIWQGTEWRDVPFAAPDKESK